MKIEGQCYCGKVRYEVNGDPVIKAQCHCRECQYFTGGHANVVMAVPEETVQYTGESPRVYRRTDLDDPVSRDFCPECGTQLISRSPKLPGMALIKVGTLNHPEVFGMPEIAIHTLDKQVFHAIPADITQFDRYPS